MRPLQVGYNPNMKITLYATSSGYLWSVSRAMIITGAALLMAFAAACGGGDGEDTPRESGRSVPPTISPAQFIAPPTPVAEATPTPSGGARVNPGTQEDSTAAARARSSTPPGTVSTSSADAQAKPDVQAQDSTSSAQARSSTPRVGPTPRVIRSASRMRGVSAPDFELETLSGELLRLSDLKGQVVVLNFWATSCPPCRAEMPSFEQIAQEYGDQGVVFIGVSVSDTPERAQAFADSVGVTYPIGVDSTNEIARAYGVIGLPTTFFISTDGTIERKLTSAANEGALRFFIRGQLS